MQRVARIMIELAAAAAAASPALAHAGAIDKIDLPPSGEHGLDMIVIDDGAMPQEPELARDVPPVEDVSWSGAPIDLLKPLHHLYTDLRRQLARYQDQWGRLPQFRLPGGRGVVAAGSNDPRVPLLRERLGFSRDGGFDAALQAKVAAYQQTHGLPATGAADADTIASLNRGAAFYERTLLLDMERARRLPPSDTPGKYILVDAAAARLWMYENGKPVDSMKVIVGKAASETPMMAALLRYASVNPYWNVPPDLVQKAIAQHVLADGTGYLATKRYEVLDGWSADARVLDPATIDWRAVADGTRTVRVRQLPGAGNFMGEIKFMLPNDYGIYLHDTPGKVLFDQDDRWLSNGCVRVEDARRLARWLFGSMPQATSPDQERDVTLVKPVPVYITYLTASVDHGAFAFRADRYGRDAPLLARFKGEGDGMVDAPKPVRLAEPKPTPAKPARLAEPRVERAKSALREELKPARAKRLATTATLAEEPRNHPAVSSSAKTKHAEEKATPPAAEAKSANSGPAKLRSAKAKQLATAQTRSSPAAHPKGPAAGAATRRER